VPAFKAFAGGELRNGVDRQHVCFPGYQNVRSDGGDAQKVSPIRERACGRSRGGGDRCPGEGRMLTI